MFRFRSDKQRRAVFAQSRRGKSFGARHPIMAGYGAATAATLVGTALLAKGNARLLRSIAKGTSAPMLRNVQQAAERLYPQLKQVKIIKNEIARAFGGGGFLTPRLQKFASKVSIQMAIARRAGESPVKVWKGLGLSPKQSGVLVLPPWGKLPTASSPQAIAHELGHGAYHLGKGGRLKSALSGLSMPLTKEGTAVLSSLAAHPLIDRSRLSEKRKRQLHLLAGAAPLAIASPMLADEALASYKGMKILRAAGATKRRLKHSRRTLAKAYASYVGESAPGVAMGGTMGAMYRKRSREREGRWT